MHSRWIGAVGLLVAAACARHAAPAPAPADAGLSGCAPGEYAHADPDFCLAVPPGYQRHSSTVIPPEARDGMVERLFFVRDPDRRGPYVVVFRGGAVWRHVNGDLTDWRAELDEHLRELHIGAVVKRLLRREPIAYGQGEFGVTEEPVDARRTIYESYAMLVADGKVVECSVTYPGVAGSPDWPLLDICRTLRPR